MIQQSKEISGQIRDLFCESALNEQAQHLGYTKRKGKLSAFEFMLAVSQALDDHGASCSLSQIGHVIHRELGISMTNEGINNRFNSLGVEFVKSIFEKLLNLHIGCQPLDQALYTFNGVYLEDASNINLPTDLVSSFKGYGSDASDAALKLNLCYDIQGSNLRLRLKSATDNDQNGLTMGAPSKSLFIRDLGYFKGDEFKGLIKQGAYFISRLPKCAKAYKRPNYRCAQHIDFEQLANSLEEGQIYDQEVYLNYKKRWKARLVVIKLPKSKAEKRKARIVKQRRKKGKKVSAKTLALNDINIYITNLCAEQWAGQQIFQLYSVRWQIEIMFKAWKSVYRIDETKQNIKGDRALFQLYIQLIQILLNTKIFQSIGLISWTNHHRELSQIKGLQTIKVRLPQFFGQFNANP
ncbi:MAG: IS4 family transposase [Cyanobacteria bacterium P01_F01_bin.116]